MLLSEISEDVFHEVVVRISTSCWSDRKGFYEKRSFIFLKRKCKGHNFVEEDLSCIEAEQVLAMIHNIDYVKDGVYSIVSVNEHRDWETGMIDDYDYELIPYEE